MKMMWIFSLLFNFFYSCCCLFKLNGRNPAVQYEFDYFYLLSLEIILAKTQDRIMDVKSMT